MRKLLLLGAWSVFLVAGLMVGNQQQALDAQALAQVQSFWEDVKSGVPQDTAAQKNSVQLIQRGGELALDTGSRIVTLASGTPEIFRAP